MPETVIKGQCLSIYHCSEEFAPIILQHTNLVYSSDIPTTGTNPSTVPSPTHISTKKTLPLSIPQTPDQSRAKIPVDRNQLPSEVIGTTLSFLRQKDLRACRFVGKRTGYATTRELFYTICLGPSLNSVNRLCRIATEHKLAVFVRCIDVIRYDLRMWPFEHVVDSVFPS
jgi:hypothetical protein